MPVMYRAVLKTICGMLCQRYCGRGVSYHQARRVGNTIRVPYLLNDEAHIVHVPFDDTKTADALGVSVVAVDATGAQENITQQDGVPYLITPNMLGCHHLLADYPAGDQKECTGDDYLVI